MDAKPEQGATLHLLTFAKTDEDPTPMCDGSYTCSCAGCDEERDLLARRGVRRRQSMPFKRAA